MTKTTDGMQIVRDLREWFATFIKLEEEHARKMASHFKTLPGAGKNLMIFVPIFFHFIFYLFFVGTGLFKPKSDPLFQNDYASLRYLKFSKKKKICRILFRVHVSFFVISLQCISKRFVSRRN
jgi:hypothetical protein